MKNTRTVQPSAGAYGFTLIELLVAVSIIGLLVALLIPAVLAAREAERRGRCAGNLRQVGIALHSYSGTHGSLPPGRMMTYDPRFSGAAPPCTSQMVDKSLFVQILPFLEQAPIYHALNSQVTIFGWENETVRLAEVSTFACPTDPGATVREGHSLQLLSYGLETPGKPYPVFFGSYAGMYGSLFVNAIPTPATRCEVPRSVLAQVNGAFNDSSPIRLESITDGLSMTVIATERALQPLNSLMDPYGASLYEQEGWMISGNWGDSLVTAQFPPNLYRKVVPRGRSSFFAASSLHPGGAHVLLGDGSVRFVKESISTWPSDPASGNPAGAKLDLSGAWVDLPPAGVWQALASRSGGELLASDSF